VQARPAAGSPDACTIPERGARAQLGLHPLQLRRAAGRQERADRRDRHPRHRHRQAAAADLEPGRLDLDRAEQGLQPTRPPFLERPQHPARRTDPVVGRMLRYLTTHHARLQLGQQRLGLGKQEADFRVRADRPRPAERHQLRRLRLSCACRRLQSHRPLHHACCPCGQASARLISPRRASRLPQVFDTSLRPPGNPARGVVPPIFDTPGLELSPVTLAYHFAHLVPSLAQAGPAHHPVKNPRGHLSHDWRRS